MSAVQGDEALAAGDSVSVGAFGVFYSTEEGDTCETVAEKFGACEPGDVYAANRHREALWNLTLRGPLARWTVLLVPRAGGGGRAANGASSAGTWLGLGRAA